MKTEAGALTVGQEALWYLHKTEPNSSAYNVVFAVRVLSGLDIAVLRRAVTALVERHDVLRSGIKESSGRPCRVVEPPERFEVRVEDYGAISDAALHDHVHAAAAEPFDLVSGAFRILVFRVEGQAPVLLLVTHHIVTDFLSQGVVMEDLLTLYEAMLDDREPQLRRLSATYDDFVRAEADTLASARGDELERFWLAECAGAPTDVPLPVRGESGPRGGETLRVPLGLPLLDRVEAFAREAEVSSFSCLVAAFEALLARYTGQDDFLVSCPTMPDLRRQRGVAGYYVNPVLVRSDVRGNETFMALARAVHDRVRRAMIHRDQPFPLVVRSLAPPRQGQRAPVGRVAFSMQAAHRSAGLLNLHASGEGGGRCVVHGVEVSAFDVPQQEGQFDLSIEVVRTDVDALAVLKYDTTLFDEDTMVRLGAHFRRLLEEALARPHRPVDGIELLEEAEVDALMRLGAGESVNVPASSLLDAMRARATERPEAIAVRSGETAVSYARLVRLVNGFATHLASRGVRPGDIVAVGTGRSAILPVVALGVMAAGATYLPIDPTLPTERIDFMLHDASAAALVRSGEGARIMLPETVLAVDLVSVDEIDEAGTLPTRAPTVDDRVPAYLIYTSGSTGRPKGVEVGHGGLANLADWQCRTLDVDSDAVVLQYASPGFDASLWEMAMALGSGATLHVPDRSAVAGSALAAEIVASGATHVTLPPSVLATFAPDQVPGLRCVIAAGEACPGPLAQTWAAYTSFYNAYGPTETTVCATANRCGPDGTVRPAIGRPLQNLSVYVVSEGLRLAPRGVVGELAVSGPAVAVGYRSRPDLTASRFVEAPWRPGARLYLTGDRARWRDDGTLEFLGRNDDQVKVRGQRVELGEIDAVLAEHPAVVHAVTTTNSAGMRLAAHVIGAELDPGELKAWAASRLPAHMVPATIHVVDSFPLTSNGKVDRGALAAIDNGPAAVIDPPTTGAEERLVAILAEELGLERVGVHDDFFLLGGHSLLAARLAFRIREAFGTELPLADILARPTAAGLARSLDDAAVRTPDPLPRANPAPLDAGKPFPLTDVQQAYLLGRREDFTLGGVSAHGYFEIEGPDLEPDRLEAAWNAIVRNHSMLRCIVVGHRQQILAEVDDYRIEVADLRTGAPAAVEAHLVAVRAEMGHQVLPADRWPLFDIRLTRTSGGRSRLHLSVDGLVADGASLRKILAEWHDAYEGRGPAAAEEVTFRDYVLAERELEATELYERSYSYWQERLDTLPAGPALPSHPGAAIADGAKECPPRFDRLHHHLPSATWQALLKTARRSGLTPSTVALTAYATTLAAWSSSRRFTLTLTMFNRLPLHPNVDRIVGDFTTVTLLEVDLREPRPFLEVAHEVQRQLWSDLDHRYYSGIRVKRDLARRGEAVSRGGDTPVVFTSALDDSGGGWGFEGFGELITATNQTPQVSLDHVVVERDGGLDLVWNVVRSEFPDGLPDTMFADYRAALEQLAHDASTWVEHRGDHRPPEQILEHRTANETVLPRRRLPLLHEPFFDMAARQPDAVAVQTPHRAVTYRELESDALRIAAGLAELQLPPSSLVAVSLPKDVVQVAAVLGVLRAGLAYVPVNPSLPRARQQTLLREARPGAVLCLAGHEVEAEQPAGSVPVIEVDRLPVQGTKPPEIESREEDLAYVIYTSGSTGTPKGVMIDHGGAMNTITDINRRYRVNNEDSVLGVSGFSFDLSVYDVFGVLAAGGTLVLPDPRQEMDPAHWRQLISDHKVTLWNSAPALMRLLLQWDELEETGALGSLTTVMLSGDWIPVDLPDLIRERCSGAEVISMGGATEASIWSVFHRVDARQPDWSSVPYGRPLADQQLHVLDESMAPRPTWVPGDLYIGGRGLALGYLHDAELTDSRFVRHPSSGTRLYRTGDRARWRPGGLLEFLGRDDQQVKINGNRIELGEVEAVLAAHPAVEAAVVSAPSVGRDRVLVGHVVLVRDEQPQADPTTPEPLAAEALREHLRQILPAPMIPSKIVKIPRMPLTSNGKIDRNRLAQEAAEAVVTEREPEPSTGSTLNGRLEQGLAEIWSTVLDRTVDSALAQFFELGGDSLSAVRILALVNERYRTSLTLGDLFEAPTIGQFAGQVRANQPDISEPSAPTTWVEEEL